MEGPIVAEWACGRHEAQFASFAATFLNPPDLFLARRDAAEPVLQAILRATDDCPHCRRRGTPVQERWVGLASPGSAEAESGVLVRAICTHREGGHWECSYNAQVKRKLLLLGDASARKAELVHPVVFDPMDPIWREKLGAKIMTRHETVSLPEQGVDFHVVFTLWDIAGGRFENKERLRTYFRGARNVLAVCDLSDDRSVEELQYWLAVARRLLGKPTVVIAARGRTTPDPLPINEARLHSLSAGHQAVVVTLPPGDSHRLEHVFQGLGIDTIRDVFGAEWHPPMYL